MAATGSDLVAAVYARVSTHDQSTAMQVDALREYVERRGWRSGPEYLDEGVSGAKDRRPALDRLMADARRRKFDAIVVFRFDRFARSVAHLARALDEFRALGVDFVSLHEAIDTSTPMGRAMCHIAGAFAELEREIIRERVRAGIANARRRGKRLGRPRAFVNLDSVAALARAGLSVREIARRTKVSKSTVQRILAVCPTKGSSEAKESADAAPGLKSRPNLSQIESVRDGGSDGEESQEGDGRTVRDLRVPAA